MCFSWDRGRPQPTRRFAYPQPLLESAAQVVERALAEQTLPDRRAQPHTALDTLWTVEAHLHQRFPRRHIHLREGRDRWELGRQRPNTTARQAVVRHDHERPYHRVA